MTTAVSFRDVDIIFGGGRREALELLDRGASRDAILEKTGAVLGVAGATLDCRRGRDLRPDGPLRFRQVDAAPGRQRPQPAGARRA